MPTPKYDDWKLNPPEPKIWGECAQCFDVILYGEEMFTTDDSDNVHVDCIDEFAREKIGARKISAGE